MGAESQTCQAQTPSLLAVSRPKRPQHLCSESLKSPAAPRLSPLLPRLPPSAPLSAPLSRAPSASLCPSLSVCLSLFPSLPFPRRTLYTTLTPIFVIVISPRLRPTLGFPSSTPMHTYIPPALSRCRHHSLLPSPTSSPTLNQTPSSLRSLNPYLLHVSINANPDTYSILVASRCASSCLSNIWLHSHRLFSPSTHFSLRLASPAAVLCLSLEHFCVIFVCRCLCIQSPSCFETLSETANSM